MSWNVSADLQRLSFSSDVSTEKNLLGFSDKQVQRVVTENPSLFSAALGQGKGLSNSVVEVFHLPSSEDVRVSSEGDGFSGFVTPGQFPITGVVASWKSTQGAGDLYVGSRGGPGGAASDSISTVNDMMSQTSVV